MVMKSPIGDGFHATREKYQGMTPACKQVMLYLSVIVWYHALVYEEEKC